MSNTRVNRYKMNRENYIKDELGRSGKVLEHFAGVVVEADMIVVLNRFLGRSANNSMWVADRI